MVSLRLGADPPRARFGKADAFDVRERLLLDPRLIGKVGTDDCASLLRTPPADANQSVSTRSSLSSARQTVDIAHVVLNRGAFRVPRPVRLLLDPATECADLGARLRVRSVGELKHAVELVVLVDPARVVDALGAEHAAKGFRVGVDRRVVLPPGGVSVGWSPIKSVRIR